MLFNSLEFIFLFLPATLAVFFALGHFRQYRAALAWLVTASLFFYSWWNPANLGLLLFSLLFNYGTGLVLSSRHKSRLVLAAGIVANLGFLGYFKYTHFVIGNINSLLDVDFNVSRIVLPLAISFFTFQQIAYLVDAWRSETKEANFLHYVLFVTFFPQLIAGPIVHHREMLPQFSQRSIYRFNSGHFSIGLAIFIIGLAKKVLLADSIAPYASAVFSAAEAGKQLTILDGWGGALGYTMQLYFDFSGYADMAIGLALMFGIVLPLNFHSPYKAVNIIEFWRRWHMTLSRFLRDYLYIPLGGNRKGRLRRHVNLLVTMVLGGLWHGAAWNFVIWGTLHGIFLVANHGWHHIRRSWLGHDLQKSTRIGRFFAILITFILVACSWVFFRAESLDGALLITRTMAGLNGFLPDAGFPAPYFKLAGFPVLFNLLLLAFLAPNTLQIVSGKRNGAGASLPDSADSWRISPAIATGCGILLFLCLKKMLVIPETEFLYFNF